MPAAFVVFEDVEDVLIPSSNSSSTSVVVVADNVLQPRLPEAQRDSLFHPEKENVDPLTGEHITVPTTKSLKRKSSPLAPKDFPAIPTKNPSVTQHTTKKARASSLSTTRSLSKRKPSDKKSSRRPSPALTMPNIREDPEPSSEERITQMINDRCYDLTVSPLADVTSMFDAVCTLNDVNAIEQADMVLTMESLKDIVLEDFPLNGPTRSARLPKMMTTGLSTPERHRLTAEYTFSSPTSTMESS